jgi:rod shape-determining protein MreD
MWCSGNRRRERVSGRSTLRVALVALLLLVLQSTVLLSIRVGGAHPDIVWLLPITAALLDGPETGAIVGFWSGLAFDLVLPTPFGLGALVGCLLGYAVGAATVAVDTRAVWLKPAAAVIGGVAADMLFSVLGAIFGQQQMVQIDFLSRFVGVAVSSLLLVIPVSRLMRWALASEGNRRTLVSAQSPESSLW